MTGRGGTASAKLDLSSGSDPGDLLCRRCTGRRDRLPHRRGEQCLPPAVFHVEAPREMPSHFAAAFGTKIMSMHPRDNPNHLHFYQPVTPGPVAVFDVRTRSLSFGRRPDPASRHENPTYFPVGGDRFLALSHDSFHLLSPPPAAAEQRPGGERCSGRTWPALQAPPFGDHVYHFYDSYAVHPDGRTIFVSVGMLTNATFSFHMPEEGLAGGWKQRGAWMLPMSGLQGPTHFDRELNAWVGMARSDEAFGHICACDVVPADPDDDGGGQPPARKLSEEKVMNDEDPAEQPVRARLIYMGAKSRYCLVEYVLCTEDKKNDAAENNRFSQEDGDDEEEQAEEEDPRTYMLRVTTFSLKLDENGDLTTGNSRRVRHYSVPEGISDRFLQWAPPVAFWM